LIEWQQQDRKSSLGVGATPPSNSSFQAYGFGVSSSGGQQRSAAAALRDSASPAASNMSRRGSHVNVNITPTSSSLDNSTPEIRRYTKRLGSDILCGSLWGECGKFAGGFDFGFIFHHRSAFTALTLT